MNSQFKKGILELCVLSTINKSDNYGYEIVNHIANYISVNEKSIYPILHRLKKEEYIKSYIKESSGGPARKYYKITELGLDRLNTELTEYNEFIIQINLLLGDNNE